MNGCNQGQGLLGIMLHTGNISTPAPHVLNTYSAVGTTGMQHLVHPCWVRRFVQQQTAILQNEKVRIAMLLY